MRVLLVQTSFLGDVVLSTPVIDGICAEHPGCELWTLTTPAGAEILSCDPRVSGRLTYDKHNSDRGFFRLFGLARAIRKAKFDRAYVLHRSYRTALLMALAGVQHTIAFREARCSFVYSETRPRLKGHHEVQRNLSLLGWSPDRAQDSAYVRLYAPSLADCRDELETFAGGGFVLLAPGSAWATKRWHWQGYSEVGRYLRERGIRVLVVGSKEEADLCRSVSDGCGATDLSGKLSISELLFVISHARVLVCNDSVPLHIAAGFSVPTVALFCSTTPSFGFGPWKNVAAVLSNEDLPCKPCGRHGFQRCPLSTEACMASPSPKEVIIALEKLVAVPMESPRAIH